MPAKVSSAPAGLVSRDTEDWNHLASEYIWLQSLKCFVLNNVWQMEMWGRISNKNSRKAVLLGIKHDILNPQQSEIKFLKFFSKFKIITLNSEWKSEEGASDWKTSKKEKGSGSHDEFKHDTRPDWTVLVSLHINPLKWVLVLPQLSDAETEVQGG